MSCYTQDANSFDESMYLRQSRLDVMSSYHVDGITIVYRTRLIHLFPFARTGGAQCYTAHSLLCGSEIDIFGYDSNY